MCGTEQTMASMETTESGRVRRRKTTEHNVVGKNIISIIQRDRSSDFLSGFKANTLLFKHFYVHSQQLLLIPVSVYLFHIDFSYQLQNCISRQTNIGSLVGRIGPISTVFSIPS